MTKKSKAQVIVLNETKAADFEKTLIEQFGSVFEGLADALEGKAAEAHIVANGIGLFVEGGRLFKIATNGRLIVHEDSASAVEAGDAAKYKGKNAWIDTSAANVAVDWAKVVELGRHRAARGGKGSLIAAVAAKLTQ